MAEVPYKASPNVEPAENIPFRPFEPKVSAETFGGLIAQGIGEAGKGISQAANTWGEIQADKAKNNAYRELDQAAVDYTAKEGQDAVGAWQQFKEQTEEITARNSEGLSGVWLNRFNNEVLNYKYRYIDGLGRTHANQAAKQVQTQTNKDGLAHVYSLATVNAGTNEQLIDGPGDQSLRFQAHQWALKQLQADGLDDGLGGERHRRALEAADEQLYKSVVEGMAIKSPQAALQYAEKHRRELGLQYDVLAERFQNKAIDDVSHGNADQWIKDRDAARAGAPTGVRVTPKPEASAERPSGWQLAIRPNAHTDRNLFSSGAARRMGIQGGVGQNLAPIDDGQGHTLQVNAAAAPHFAGFLKELTQAGYKISDIGGYNPRMIAGTHTLSEHAFGNAIDINPDQNPRSGGTNLPPNVGAIAAKYGLIWGGDWAGNSRDPMHFEWSGKTGRVAGLE